MHVVDSGSAVRSLVIHLGYLVCDRDTNKCFIPNKEVADEMNNAVNATKWTQLAKVLENSQRLLEDTISGNEQAVAKAIDLAHDENTSILSYNNENSLACVLTIAYIYAQNDYIVHRELATGKGFADLVLIPRRNVDKPAVVLELKYKKDVEAAIDQIKRKQYVSKIEQYTGDILLVGINYDKKEKRHTCVIETVTKKN